MKFALATGERVEAFAGGRGVCPSCRGEVIAKCGTHRVPHWAHRGIRDCDSWAEPETEWHRAWKNQFPAEYQECVQHDETGERHIADVRTNHGLVLEFQHSHLDPQERAARERFYKNMLWIVDGTRLQRDYPRFLKGRDRFTSAGKPGYFLLPHPDEYLPKMWLDSLVPVIFDFRGNGTGDSSDPYRNVLWCLFPGRAEGFAVVVGMRPEDFVGAASTRLQLIEVKETLANISQVLRELGDQQYRKWLAPQRMANRLRHR
ncbi:competence protein CoiA [Bradyrhizobium sp. HKCCYLS2038]|uniref:competence protein CoiA n=1 Tax=unclassified Bradyrhizobium TaxID=2631580 RepID=UPI003EBC108A